jgi:hypothetical protein
VRLCWFPPPALARLLLTTLSLSLSLRDGSCGVTVNVLLSPPGWFTEGGAPLAATRCCRLHIALHRAEPHHAQSRDARARQSALCLPPSVGGRPRSEPSLDDCSGRICRLGGASLSVGRGSPALVI